MPTRRTTIVLILIGMAVSAANGFGWDAGLGVSVAPGGFYNWKWAPAISGGSLSADLRPGGSLGFLRTGIEAGITGLGIELVAPVGVEFTLAGFGAPARLTAGARGLAGVALFRPLPFAVVGGEAGVSWIWFWSRHIGMEVDIFVRYETSPGYIEHVAPYQVLDLPVTVSLRYRPLSPHK